ncbi:hypothetical protein PGT21_027936 [Puccinia graminis f. sp. tritici]|uniref:Uncharacterized protein n=1 Tax=Puccinia graminis f. sp. tritici TaxID=56615 RepID=A0A5B0Q737_PUCGR|nr:hypothetical protein PGT21_027936 [Puccinia graminis f. sp. tritici]
MQPGPARPAGFRPASGWPAGGPSPPNYHPYCTPIRFGVQARTPICAWRAVWRAREGLACVYQPPKNSIDDFEGIKEQTDDIRMDALAVTPVCLRIAFALDNRKGHIPMSTNDSDYIEEKIHETNNGFPNCRCSNCMPQEAIQLYDNMRELTAENFSDAVTLPSEPQRPTTHQ